MKLITTASGALPSPSSIASAVNPVILINSSSPSPPSLARSKMTLVKSEIADLERSAGCPNSFNVAPKPRAAALEKFIALVPVTTSFVILTISDSEALVSLPSATNAPAKLPIAGIPSPVIPKIRASNKAASSPAKSVDTASVSAAATIFNISSLLLTPICPAISA